MSNGANLATSELRQAYDQVAIDLKNSLAEVDRELMSFIGRGQRRMPAPWKPKQNAMLEC
jgi:hypothetical protein